MDWVASEREEDGLSSYGWGMRGKGDGWWPEANA